MMLRLIFLLLIKTDLGAVGASFGGFSVYYLAGHHDKRFKCFIAHDGAFNLESMYTDTEEDGSATGNMMTLIGIKT
jgi:S-formylglutathione hydrolase FrmB